ASSRSHPCLTRRRRPSMACHLQTPAATPPRRCVATGSSSETEEQEPGNNPCGSGHGRDALAWESKAIAAMAAPTERYKAGVAPLAALDLHGRPEQRADADVHRVAANHQVGEQRGGQQ